MAADASTCASWVARLRTAIHGLRPVAEPAVGLAALRVVVAVLIAVAPQSAEAVALAAQPERLLFLPEGLGWTDGLLPVTPEGASAARALLLGSAVTAALGVWTRASLSLLTASALWCWSIPQRTGAVLHDMHLLWFAALLAVSPGADALSVDAWLARGRGWAEGLSPRRVHGVALTVFRLLLGAIYLFPGIHKLATSPSAWLDGEALVAHAHHKWLQIGRVPALRFDEIAGLAAAGGTLVVCFELVFVLLVLTRRGRWVALLGGLAFHGLAQLWLGIPFVGLWACYVVLVDWGAVLRAFGLRPPPGAHRPESSPGALLAVGAALLAAVAVQGAREATGAWPIGCYPTFSYVPGPDVPDLRVELELGDGRRLALTDRPPGTVRSQRDWAAVWRLAGAYGEVADDEALRAYVHRVVAARGMEEARASAAALRLYRIRVAVDPALDGREVGTPVLLWEGANR